MFGLGAATRIFVATGATDMRLSFDGLPFPRIQRIPIRLCRPCIEEVVVFRRKTSFELAKKAAEKEGGVRYCFLFNRQNDAEWLAPILSDDRGESFSQASRTSEEVNYCKFL